MAYRCGDKDKNNSKHVPSTKKGNSDRYSPDGINGELYFYVNDVPRHYENNGGRIFIKIGLATRLI